MLQIGPKKGRSGILSDLRWGIAGGLWVAAFYCAWVTGVYIFRGPGPFERNGVSFFSTVLTYIGIGAIGGGLVGLLRPFSERKLGAYAVGLVVGLLVAMGIGLLVAGSPVNWQFAEWTAILFVTPAAGWAIGSELWKRRRDIT